MTFEITAVYAALLGIIWAALNIPISVYRSKSKIALGHQDDAILLARIRREGNFIETVPLALILLALAEAGGLGAMWLHISGGVLLAARIAHPLGIAGGLTNPLRMFGALGTKISMLISIIAILAHAFAG